MIVIVDITVVNISGVNLNLLLVFDALAEERNVTRAARRLGLTQSAASNALAQLRQLLGDPLFVRARRGVVPTERALAMAGPVRQALALVSGALQGPEPFVPARSRRTFAIAASDYVEYVVLPPLLRRLEREAPGIRVEVRPWGLHEVPPGLDAGDLDLMIGYYDLVPPGHREEELFKERYVCVVRKKHPRVGGRLTLKHYVELSHVLVSQRSKSPGSVDRALARLGHTRTVGVRVSHFLMVPELVARTNMVAALSRRIAEPAARALPLVIHPPPLALPESTVGQVWHARADADPAHLWFRRLVRDVCREV
jgi:DNA-binding transcriptional LysR family regulator